MFGRLELATLPNEAQPVAEALPEASEPVFDETQKLNRNKTLRALRRYAHFYSWAFSFVT